MTFGFVSPADFVNNTLLQPICLTDIQSIT